MPSLAIHTIPPAGTLPGIVSTDNTLTDDLPFTRALFTASTYALMHPRGWIEGKSKRGEEGWKLDEEETWWSATRRWNISFCPFSESINRFSPNPIHGSQISRFHERIKSAADSSDIACASREEEEVSSRKLVFQEGRWWMEREEERENRSAPGMDSAKGHTGPIGV